MSADDLRDRILDATREAYPRKPGVVAAQVARWFARAERAVLAPTTVDADLCGFCKRDKADVWAQAQSDSSLRVSREKGAATVGVCSDCLQSALALRTDGVPPRDEIRRRVQAVLERVRDAEALEELRRIIAVAPALTSDVKDAVCSICSSPVSFRLVAGGRVRICDRCLKALQAGTSTLA